VTYFCGNRANVEKKFIQQSALSVESCGKFVGDDCRYVTKLPVCAHSPFQEVTSVPVRGTVSISEVV